MGGGRSSSATTSTNVTSQTDARIGASDQALVISGSDGVSLSTVTTDHGAVTGALASNRAVVDSLTSWGIATGEAATRVQLGALESNTEVAGAALAFGADALGAALGFGNEALGLVGETQRKAFDWAAEAAKTADERNYQTTIKYVALAGVAYVALRVFVK